MNDRFKFRVAIRQVDGTYKRYQADVIGWVADKLYAKCAIPDNIIRSVTITDVLIDSENAILEQCTGLTDRNGKLIYEGDLVDFNGEYSGKVLFKNGCFVWDWGFNDPPIYGLDKEYMEIIGNIHDKEQSK